MKGTDPVIQEANARRMVGKMGYSTARMAKPDKPMRGCVISGGGKLGCVGVGYVSQWKRDYDVLTGISTGDLIVPLVAAGEYEALEEGYTSVDNSLFNVNPFNKKGKISIPNAVFRTLRGKTSWGEMYPLRSKFIPMFFPEEVFNRVRTSGKEVFVHALNIDKKPSVTEPFSTADTDYETFCNAMFAGCCFVPIANVATVNNYSYVDAGFVETIAIYEMLVALYSKTTGPKTVDVIVLRPKQEEIELDKSKHLGDVATRLYGAVRYDVAYENLVKACKLAASREDLTINVYYLPKEPKITGNPMDFDKDQMKWMVELGKDHAFDPDICESF